MKRNRICKTRMGVVENKYWKCRLTILDGTVIEVEGKEMQWASGKSIRTIVEYCFKNSWRVYDEILAG